MSGEFRTSSLRRHDANRDRRRIGGIGLDAAGDLAFANECRLISRRPAIGAHQYFVAAARRRAPAAQAVHPNDPHTPAGRTLLALRSRRTGRTRGAGITLRPKRPPQVPDRPSRPARNRQTPATAVPRVSTCQYAFFQPAGWSGGIGAPHFEGSMLGRIPKLAARSRQRERRCEVRGKDSRTAPRCHIEAEKKCRKIAAL